MFLFFLYVYYFSCEKDKYIILNHQIIKKLLRLFNISFFGLTYSFYIFALELKTKIKA